MGTTPVYYFDITALTQVKEQYERYGRWGDELEQSIAGGRCDFTKRDTLSGTFAKTYTRGKGIVTHTPQEQVAKFAAGEASIVSFGTACYWDIFRNPHRIHFCFQWSGVDTSPLSCLEQDEDEE